MRKIFRERSESDQRERNFSILTSNIIQNFSQHCFKTKQLIFQSKCVHFCCTFSSAIMKISHSILGWRIKTALYNELNCISFRQQQIQALPFQANAVYGLKVAEWMPNNNNVFPRICVTLVAQWDRSNWALATAL